MNGKTRTFDDGINANAFKHAYWNALIVYNLRKNEGERFAKIFTDSHEYGYGVNQSVDECNNATMDLYNNKVGIDVGVKYAGQKDKTDDNQKDLLTKIANGELVRVLYEPKSEMHEPFPTDGSGRKEK